MSDCPKHGDSVGNVFSCTSVMLCVATVAVEGSWLCVTVLINYSPDNSDAALRSIEFSSDQDVRVDTDAHFS